MPLRFTPYYTVFDTSLPGDPRKNEFVLLRPFVPFSTNDERTELQAYMTASSDPEDYGKLTSYFVQESDGRLPDGPLRVASNAESTEAISRRISLDNVGGGGSQVRFGDLQIVPVAGGLIYVRPYYVSVPQSSGSASTVTEFRSVIVSYNDRAVLEPTLAQGLARLFPGFQGEIGDRIDTPAEPTNGADPGAAPATDDTTDAATPATGARTRAARPTPCSCSTRPMHSSTRRTRPWPTAISARTRPRSTRPGRTSPKRCRSSRTDTALRAGATEPFGELGEVLAELDLVAGLLGRETLGAGLDRFDVVADLVHLVGELGGDGRDAVVEQRHP